MKGASAGAGAPASRTSGRVLMSGAFATVAGLALAATAPIVGTAAADAIRAQQAVGGILVVAGWALLAWGLHRFGRESGR